MLEEADLPVGEKDVDWNTLSHAVSDICLCCKQMTLLPEQQPVANRPSPVWPREETTTK